MSPELAQAVIDKAELVSQRSAELVAEATSGQRYKLCNGRCCIHRPWCPYCDGTQELVRLSLELLYLITPQALQPWPEAPTHPWLKAGRSVLRWRRAAARAAKR